MPFVGIRIILVLRLSFAVSKTDEILSLGTGDQFVGFPFWTSYFLRILIYHESEHCSGFNRTHLQTASASNAQLFIDYWIQKSFFIRLHGDCVLWADCVAGCTSTALGLSVIEYRDYLLFDIWHFNQPFGRFAPTQIGMKVRRQTTAFLVEFSWGGCTLQRTVWGVVGCAQISKEYFTVNVSQTMVKF